MIWAAALALVGVSLAWAMPAPVTHRAAAEGPGEVAEVRAYSAQAHHAQVFIWWESSRDFEIALYRCRRSVEADEAGEVIYQVAAQGDVGMARYQYVDRPPAPGAYYYRVEEVKMNGYARSYPSIRVFVGRHWAHLPWATRQ